MKFEKKKKGKNPLTIINSTRPRRPPRPGRPPPSRGLAGRRLAGRRPAAAWPAAAAGPARASLQIQGERGKEQG